VSSAAISTAIQIRNRSFRVSIFNGPIVSGGIPEMPSLTEELKLANR